MRRAATLLLLFTTIALYAQKAQPVAIPLRDGEGIAHGRLKGRQQMDYHVASVGQTLTVAMTAAPRRTLTVRVYDPEGALVPLQKDGTDRWTADLAKPGDYGISVVRTNTAAAPSRYSLKVSFH
jgi:hypothetical protein